MSDLRDQVDTGLSAVGDVTRAATSITIGLLRLVVNATHRLASGVIKAAGTVESKLYDAVSGLLDEAEKQANALTTDVFGDR